MIQSATLTELSPQGRTLLRSAKPRRLGSLFIPLRRVYLFVMPAILFAGALFCWALGTDLSVITGALLLSGVTAYLLFDLLGHRAPLRVSTVLAGTLGIAYGIGTANTWFTLPRGGEDLGDFFHINTASLAHAMGSIQAAVALLLLLGEAIETPIFGEEFELRFNNRSLVFLTFGTAVLIASFAHGSTGFMGVTAGEGADIGHLGYLANLSEWLTGSLFAMAVCVSVNVKGNFSRLYARGLSLVLALMLFPLGRRTMIFSVLLTLLALRLGRYKVPFSPIKKAILLAMLGGIIYMAAIGFYYLRIAGYGLIKPTLMQRIHAGIELAKVKSFSEVKQLMSQNVQTRTFVLGFLSQLEGYTEIMPGAHGEDIAKQFQLAIPSILYSGKDLFFQEEHLANELFGSTYTDEANTILTAGTVDFGVWGLLAYPLLAAVMLRLFIEFVSESLPVFASCFIILASFSTILEPELATVAYFLILRNGILFGSFVWFVISLPEFRIKNVGL